MVTLLTCIREMAPVRISTETQIILRFSWLYSVPSDKRQDTALTSGHDRLLPHPCQFITRCQWIIRRYIVWVMKESSNELQINDSNYVEMGKLFTTYSAIKWSRIWSEDGLSINILHSYICPGFAIVIAMGTNVCQLLDRLLWRSDLSRWTSHLWQFHTCCLH